MIPVRIRSLLCFGISKNRSFWSQQQQQKNLFHFWRMHCTFCMYSHISKKFRLERKLIYNCSFITCTKCQGMPGFCSHIPLNCHLKTYFHKYFLDPALWLLWALVVLAVHMLHYSKWIINYWENVLAYYFFAIWAKNRGMYLTVQSIHRN